MKNRLFVSITAIALALITSFGFSSTAYAVSRTNTTEIVGIGRNEDEAANGQVLGAQRGSATTPDGVKAAPITNKAAADSLNLDTVANLVSKAQNTTVAGNDYSILDAMDVSVSAGTVLNAENPIYISFSFPGLTANTEVYVLHFENGAWVIVPSTVKDGMVIAKFTSLSPVAIVAKTGTLKGSVLGADRSKSPRTGDDRYMMVLALVAVLGAVGVVSKRRMFS